MSKPTREQAELAVKTLIEWIGEDSNRDGLLDTPKRVVDSFDEFYSGYKEDPKKILSKHFENTGSYKNMVLVKEIDFFSHCEHHLAPIVGTAHLAYFPTDTIVGISKIARIVDVFARRLQTQEQMTEEIASSIQDSLKPLGIAVFIDAQHMCMTTRGVSKHSSSTVTTHFSGKFEQEENRQLFLASIKA